MLRLGAVLSWVLFLVACSQEQVNSNFRIDGNVKNLDDGKLYFIHQGLDGDPIIDTVFVQGGKFTYEGNISEATPFYISTNLLRTNKKPPTLIFLEPESMSMVLDVDNLDGVELLNSESQKEYDEYKAADAPYKERVDSIYRVAMSNKGNAEMQTSLEELMHEVDSQESNLIADFVEDHKNSVVSAYLISGKFMSRGEFGRAKELFSMLRPGVKNTVIGKQISDVLSKVALTEPGAKAPDFSQQNTNGDIVKLSDYRGKYVLVDFWASWCSPCRQENPSVRKAYTKYKDDNFEIIGISLDRDRSQWVKAIQMDNLPWVQLSDLNGWDNEVSKTYGVQSIPENFLIDPKGKIVAKSLRGEQLNSKLAEIFGH